VPRIARQDSDGPSAILRWQYAVVWRYGPLGLVLLGLAMIVYAMVDDKSDAVTISLLTLGFVSVLAGIVLPRIEGEFSASGQGVTGKLLSVTQLDSRRYVAVGPALASDSKEPIADQDTRITVGDVWDELEAHGFRVIDAATGQRLLRDGSGHQLELSSRDHGGWQIVSPELLRLVRAWGLNPTASGKYSSPQYD
jgi:hypothetical protein